MRILPEIRQKSILVKLIFVTLIGAAAVYAISTHVVRQYKLTKIVNFGVRFYANHPHRKKVNNMTELQDLSSKLRLYATVHQQLARNFSKNDVPTRLSLVKYTELEQRLFPFLTNTTALHLQKSLLPGRGLAVCVNSRYLRFVLLLIKNLRLLNSSLPVEVFYKTGELQATDLARLHAQGIKSFNVDLLIGQPLDKFSNERFAIKPFALLFASYEETMLVDADTVFYQNPDLLFDNAGYLDTGTLLFPDRYFSYRGRDGMGPSWFDENLLQPISDVLRNSQIYRGKSNYFVESGVVLINKRRGLVGSLAACGLVTIYRDMWFAEGDQESFWFGFELLHQKYFVHQIRPGLIGWLLPNPQTKVLEVCGNLLHPGDNGRPFWSNGGVVYKWDSDIDPIKFEAFAIEGNADTLRIGRYICLEEIPPVNLNDVELAITKSLVENSRSINSGLS